MVAHHMSVIAIQAEAAPYKTADPPPELMESFGEIRASALAGLAELRRVLGVLRTGGPGTRPSPDWPIWTPCSTRPAAAACRSP